MIDIEKQSKDILQTILGKGARIKGGKPDDVEAWQAQPKDGPRLHIQVKKASVVRHAQIRGEIAVAMLQLTKAIPPKDVGVVLMALPRVTDAIAADVASFMAEYGGSFGWGLFDPNGGLRLIIPPLGVDVTKHSLPASRPRARRAGQSLELFTDAHRWLLQLLLLRHAKREHWSGPQQDYRNASELGMVAGVAPETASRFARTFVEAGFLRLQSGQLKLVRVPALMERWLDQDSHLRQRAYPVRSLWGPITDLPSYMGQWWPHKNFGVVCGFEACRHLGVLRTESPAIELYLQPDWQIERMLKEIELEACDPRDAHLTLIEPRFPRSALGGSVRLESNMWVVNVLQAALDVVSHAARGREQAEYIVNEVLGVAQS